MVIGHNNVKTFEPMDSVLQAPIDHCDKPNKKLHDIISAVIYGILNCTYKNPLEKLGII